MPKQARQLVSAAPAGFTPVDQVVGLAWAHKSRGLLAIPDNYFSHTITDPPYSAHVHAKKMSGTKGGKHKATPVTFDALTSQELVAVAAQMVRTTRGWIVVFCADDDMRAWRDALADAGAARWVTCIWTKPNGTPQFRGEGPSQPCEHFVTAWCGEGRPEWNGGGKMGNYVCSTEPAKTRRHETQKPLRLMKDIVLDFTLPGDLISDPYCGAGTTGMAARVTGRRFVMWERDGAHAKAARRWIKPAREQLRLEEVAHHARPQAFGKPRRRKVVEVQEVMDFNAP